MINNDLVSHFSKEFNLTKSPNSATLPNSTSMVSDFGTVAEFAKVSSAVWMQGKYYLCIFVDSLHEPHTGRMELAYFSRRKAYGNICPVV